MSSWLPSAPRSALVARQKMYQTIREYFLQRAVLEVETPLLCTAPVADPNITPMQVEQRWLHTSPEYAMKRMLCAGYGDIYQICKVFRDGEAGRRHNPEFSMLEWYRVGWSHRQLMDEVAELLQLLLAARFAELPCLHLTYAQAFNTYAQLNVHNCSDAEIAQRGQQLANADLELDRDGWLDIIISHQIEPALPHNTLVFIDQFPASQAALAQLTKDEHGVLVAQRFEVFFNGMELANGYQELTDAQQQLQRFQHELRGTQRPHDAHLIAALEHGLADCAGVALGLDRVLLHLLEAEHIAQVVSFDWSRA